MSAKLLAIWPVESARRPAQNHPVYKCGFTIHRELLCWIGGIGLSSLSRIARDNIILHWVAYGSLDA